MHIGICTGGGDAPGLNAAIRAGVHAAVRRSWAVTGIRRGWAGLLDGGALEALDRTRVRGIAHLGGTILASTNQIDPSLPRDGEGTDRLDEVIETARAAGIEAVVAIGGEGTMAIAHKVSARGLPVVGVPKTIDNDVHGTLETFGFDTAVTIFVDALDRLHSTAESHDRVFVIEVMGRHAGFIALHGGIAGTADAILIPEIPYRVEAVAEKIRERQRAGRDFALIVAAEGAHEVGKDTPERLGGVAEGLAPRLAGLTGKDCRSLVLGHLQRGGPPTARDRLLATRLGVNAVTALAEGKSSDMVAVGADGTLTTVPLADVVTRARRVDPGGDLVGTARELGISLGDGAPAVGPPGLEPGTKGL